jgi:hypothetical protein
MPYALAQIISANEKTIRLVAPRTFRFRRTNMAMVTAIPMTDTAIPFAMHRSLSEDHSFFLFFFGLVILTPTNDNMPPMMSSSKNFADPTGWLADKPL